MGAYSTLDITQEEALKLLYAALETASDETICDVLLVLVSPKTGHNYRIVENEHGAS